MPPDTSSAAPPGATTWGDALRAGARTLAKAGCTATPELDAAVLLGHVVGANRAILMAYPERTLTPGQAASYRALLARRAVGEPVAYLTGHKEFMGLDLLVDPRALIPRPETELLVEAALADAHARLDRGEPPRAADIGTGSGAIALALAVHEPRLPPVYATDLSPDALALAAENARRLGVADRVILLEGDLVAPLPEPVDLLLANLPYIPPQEADELPPDVTRYEPALALYGAGDGLGHFRRLFVMLDHRVFTDRAPRGSRARTGAAPPPLSTTVGSVPRAHLRPGATLFLELGHDQRPAVTRLARRHLPGARLHFLADYAGWDRVLVAETDPGARAT